MTYEVGYEVTKTSEFEITTHGEISAVAKFLGLGASIEASIKRTEDSSEFTKVKTKVTEIIPAGEKLWHCQRIIYLNSINVPKAVQIFDSETIINGDVCDSG